MSVNTFDSAHDFLPEARTSYGGKIRSVLKLIAQAISEGRAAEAAYRHEIGRGTEPSKAARKAFTF